VTVAADQAMFGRALSIGPRCGEKGAREHPHRDVPVRCVEPERVTVEFGVVAGGLEVSLYRPVWPAARAASSAGVAAQGTRDDHTANV